MATAEMAAALPVLVLLLGFAVSVISIGAQQVRAEDAAREAARAAARGDLPRASQLAAAVAPGARVTVTRSGDDVIATVELRAHLVGSWSPAVTVSERAVAATEPVAGAP
jgi:Flp pilus assembly protein TadG